jgi:hypothetical protein
VNWIELTALGAVSCRDDYDCYIVLEAEAARGAFS